MSFSWNAKELLSVDSHFNYTYLFSTLRKNWRRDGKRYGHKTNAESSKYCIVNCVGTLLQPKSLVRWTVLPDLFLILRITIKPFFFLMHVFVKVWGVGGKDPKSKKKKVMHGCYIDC